MKRSSLVSITTLGLLAISAPGCLEGDSAPVTLNTVQAPAQDEAQRDTQLKLRLAAESPLVHFVSYEIINNASGEIISKVVEVNPNMAIPGGVPELEDRPLDKNTKHRFTDLYVSLPAGSYSVSVTPLGEDKKSMDGVCFGGSRDTVIVDQGQTTEIFLMVQCTGQTQGALDILVGINHPPHIVNVELENVGNETGSPKYTCGDTIRVCATADDIDNDPLAFVVEGAPLDCEIVPDSEPVFPTNPVGQALTQCFEITCKGEQYKGTRVDINVHVLDMAWRGNRLVTMETILRDMDINQSSRAVMHAMGNFLSKEACETSSNGCITNYLPRDIVLVQDASDSMKRYKRAVEEAIPDLYRTLNVSWTNDALDEDGKAKECQDKTQYNTRIALSSGVDKPFGIFGANSDWVYRQERSATPASQMNELVKAHQNLVFGVGAGPGEAQIETLLTAADNMTSLGFGADSSTPRYAVVLTNSKFLAAGKCPWENVAAPVCQRANNYDGIVDLAEDYPSVEKVVKHLDDAKLHPIFVIVGEGDGVLDTRGVTEQYQAEFIDQSTGHASVVTTWLPGSPKGLDQVVLDAIAQIDAKISG